MYVRMMITRFVTPLMRNRLNKFSSVGLFEETYQSIYEQASSINLITEQYKNQKTENKIVIEARDNQN